MFRQKTDILNSL